MRKMKKLPFIIFIIIIITMFIGFFYLPILSLENKKLVRKTISSFFKLLSKNKLNYQSAFVSSILENTLITCLIWLFGISLVGSIIIVFIIGFKSFLIGFSISSLFNYFGIKGIPLIIVYIIPSIINLIIILYLSYHALKFSYMIFKSLTGHETFSTSKSNYFKNYIKILFIVLIFGILSSFVEVYLISKLITYMI